MAPKKQEGGKKPEPASDLSPSALETLLPTWTDANVSQEDKSGQKGIVSYS